MLAVTSSYNIKQIAAVINTANSIFRECRVNVVGRRGDLSPWSSTPSPYPIRNPGVQLSFIHHLALLETTFPKQELSIGMAQHATAPPPQHIKKYIERQRFSTKTKANLIEKGFYKALEKLELIIRKMYIKTTIPKHL